MGAVATHPRPASLAGAPAGELASERLFEPGGFTLEDRVLDLWEDLSVSGTAQCPVCGDRMLADGCDGCGAELG